MDKKKFYIAPEECEASAVDMDINALSCTITGESEDKGTSGGGTTDPVNPWGDEDDNA